MKYFNLLLNTYDTGSRIEDEEEDEPTSDVIDWESRRDGSW